MRVLCSSALKVVFVGDYTNALQITGQVKCMFLTHVLHGTIAVPRTKRPPKDNRAET